MSLFFYSDAHYAAVKADLESDAQDLEGESWSNTVDQPHVKKHSKETVKRQDVIYGRCDFLSVNWQLTDLTSLGSCYCYCGSPVWLSRKNAI